MPQFFPHQSFGRLGQHDGADNGSEQEDADNFKLQQIVAEHRNADGRRIPVL